MKTLVIIPCYNEEASIVRVVERLKATCPQVDYLVINDTVEAAVRSIPDPTREKISQMISKLVRGKMEDGQLDECTLCFRDIDKIRAAFENVLKGVFHERIEYPKVDLRKNHRACNHRAKGEKAPAPAEEKK